MNYNYFPNLDQLVFEDGVCYTTEEAVIISKIKNPYDVRAMHEIKKIFGGKILRPGEDVDKNDSWFDRTLPVTDPDPTPIIKCRDVSRNVSTRNVSTPDAEILSFL
jgi:hypothetical protein